MSDSDDIGTKNNNLDALSGTDADDKDLQKYKAALGLGGADYSPADGPRRVVIQEMTILFDGGRAPIQYTFANADDLASLKNKPFTLKEGCNYKIKVAFRIQQMPVLGLKYVNEVQKAGQRVAKDEEMLGTYTPRESPYEVTFPEKEWQEAPQGMDARGNYKGRSKFVDDDAKTHAEYEYSFYIKQDWA